MNKTKESNKDVVNELAESLYKHVTLYFENKENRKAFEDWYLNKYHKPYKWKTKAV